jgi:hypothetical protein
MKDQPPIFLTDINIHSDTQAEPRKLSSLTLIPLMGVWGGTLEIRCCNVSFVFLSIKLITVAI